MQLVDALTINEDPKNEVNVLEILEEAFEYFPEGLWSGIKYLGNINVKHDLKIISKKKVFGTFIFKNLINRIREIKNTLKNDHLLLAVTHDPVIAIYYRYESERYKQTINLVRDYASKDVGFVSLFQLEEETAVRITAHGLGHSQYLKHHGEPIDLMYEGLLDRHPIRINGFCDICHQKLKNRIVI